MKINKYQYRHQTRHQNVKMNTEINTTDTNSSPVERRCSFCRQTGHNITNCNDERLIEFENSCLSVHETLSEREFYTWICDYAIQHPSLSRAYAVRYCGGSIRNRNFVDRIVQQIAQISTSRRVRNNLRTINTITNLFRRTDLPISQTVEELVRTHGMDNPQVSHELLTIAYTMTILSRFNENITQNKKFNINTNIVERADTDKCECNICYQDKEMNKFVKLNCGHKFCKDCMKETLKNVRTKNPQCAFCRSEIKNMELSNHEIRDEFDGLINL
jgi:hypothetical protein